MTVIVIKIITVIKYENNVNEHVHVIVNGIRNVLNCHKKKVKIKNVNKNGPKIGPYLF